LLSALELHDCCIQQPRRSVGSANADAVGGSKIHGDCGHGMSFRSASQVCAGVCVWCHHVTSRRIISGVVRWRGDRGPRRVPNLTARTSRGSWLLVRSRDSHCWRSRRRLWGVATEDFGLSILSVLTLHGITVWQLALLIVYTARAQFAAGAGSKAGREYPSGNLFGRWTCRGW
jgi:hypothetical protein